MEIKKILEKLDKNEELTLEEIEFYELNYKPPKQVYGKYGTLAKQYIEEHNQGKLLSLVDNFSDYLHNIDRQANEIYDDMYQNLTLKEEFKRTGNFLEDAKRINQVKSIINEYILNELVYVK